MPAVEDDLSLLVRAAHAAGKVATGFVNAPNKSWDKPDGAGPVTEADLAVNRLLEDTLRGARPDYGWLSEESEDNAARLSCEHVFVVDPIDGTRSFIQGGRTWAHSLAVVRNGMAVAGVVYLPMRDRLYAAALGSGAHLNGARIAPVPDRAMSDSEVLTTRPVMAPANWPGGVPDFRRGYRPSLAYRMALVAQGRFDAMITLRPAWEWDIAAGAILQHESGVSVTNRTGQELVFNNPLPQLNGVISARPGLQAELLAALGPA